MTTFLGIVCVLFRHSLLTKKTLNTWGALVMYFVLIGCVTSSPQNQLYSPTGGLSLPNLFNGKLVIFKSSPSHKKQNITENSMSETQKTVTRAAITCKTVTWSVVLLIWGKGRVMNIKHTIQTAIRDWPKCWWPPASSSLRQSASDGLFESESRAKWLIQRAESSRAKSELWAERGSAFIRTDSS